MDEASGGRVCAGSGDDAELCDLGDEAHGRYALDAPSSFSISNSMDRGLWKVLGEIILPNIYSLFCEPGAIVCIMSLKAPKALR